MDGRMSSSVIPYTTPINFPTAVRLKPGDYQAWVYLGNSLDYESRVTEAIAAYKEALKLKPDNADAYAELGVLYNRSKNYVEAERYAREAIKRRPDYAKYHKQLALNLRMLKRFDESLNAINEAVRLSPKDVDIIVELGHLYADMRNQARTAGKTVAATGFEIKAKEQVTKLQSLDPDKAQKLSDYISPNKTLK